jgi:hypothetical protein
LLFDRSLPEEAGKQTLSVVLFLLYRRNEKSASRRSFLSNSKIPADRMFLGFWSFAAVFHSFMKTLHRKNKFLSKFH